MPPTLPSFDAPQVTADGTPEVDREAAQLISVSVLVHAPEGQSGAPYEQKVVVHPFNIPNTERAIFKKATGLHPALLLDDFDEVAACGFWFLGRRLAGEWTLTWDRACAQLPQAIDGSEFEVDIDDGQETPEDPDPQL